MWAARTTVIYARHMAYNIVVKCTYIPAPTDVLPHYAAIGLGYVLYCIVFILYSDRYI